MLHHVALEAQDRHKSERFFTQILGLSKTKTMTLSPTLNSAIFGREEQLDLETYANEHMCVEVFITGRTVAPTYQHLCLAVPDQNAFAEKCKANDVVVITAQKGDRELLFVRDFSGNLYEIKEA